MKVFGNSTSKSFGTLEKYYEATKSVLSLPVEPLQNEGDTQYVANCIKEYISQ